MKSKILAVVFLGLFLINFGSALLDSSSTQVNPNINTGLIIDYPKFDYVKVGAPFNISVHVYNISNGLEVINANCSLRIYNQTGYEGMNRTLTYVSGSYNLFIAQGNFTQGINSFLIQCSTADLGGFASGNFLVTKSGIILDLPEAILYIALILINLLMFSFFLYWAMVLPFSEEMNPDGTITAISKKKYIKILSAWFAYGSFLWFFAIFTGIVNNFVSLEVYTGLISSFYLVLYGLGIGFTFLILAVLFVLIWKDILYNKEIRKFGKAVINAK